MLHERMQMAVTELSQAKGESRNFLDFAAPSAENVGGAGVVPHPRAGRKGKGSKFHRTLLLNWWHGEFLMFTLSCVLASPVLPLSMRPLAGKALATIAKSELCNVHSVTLLSCISLSTCLLLLRLCAFYLQTSFNDFSIPHNLFLLHLGEVFQ